MTKYFPISGLILLICCIAMNSLDLSILYHIVRGQSVIKLYVIYNMLDVSLITSKSLSIKNNFYTNMVTWSVQSRSIHKDRIHHPPSWHTSVYGFHQGEWLIEVLIRLLLCTRESPNYLWIEVEFFDWISSLQIADRLFSSIGQDTLDALFWTAAEPRQKRSCIMIALHFVLASVYVCIL